MIFLGVLLNVFIRGSVQVSASRPLPVIDCLEAEQGCVSERGCEAAYRVLEYCAAEEAVAPLGPDARHECLEAQSSVQQYRPLLACKCQRGSRREELCLGVYWTVRFSQGYDEYEASPYEDLEQGIMLSHMASIVAASSLPLDGQNQCLKAAQDCGLFEKCGSLRSEYVLACTKRAPGSDHCNRQKCHRALRRFLERVPEAYSFGVLFCPCADALCGERRRKTIVPSCSYQERDGKPNCLSLQGYCMKDELCRSRLADFQHNCQPSSLSASGCQRESGAVCLKAYAGLIGTIMTPNYVSNVSMEVSQWCDCEGSGNQWQDCLRILHMFNTNGCLRNAISAMGSSINVLPEINTVEESEEREAEEEDEEAVGQDHAVQPGEEFNVIPPYSEKATESNVDNGAPGSHRGVADPATSLLPPLLLSATFSWGYRG
ncbi:hypothetical protein COCON_G00043820 [Conger conger]|uniref:GDNF/GAS1 domain-containing protein n=1 Tax=Conger conger TaxID=82655 RepID=A0A9Q1I4Z5_CONCO|nr:hypothetical protein COCON_G00043820 [Conger conger]